VSGSSEITREIVDVFFLFFLPFYLSFSRTNEEEEEEEEKRR
jgi:hypothetical protein